MTLCQTELLRRSRAAGRIRTADLHLSEVTVLFTTGLHSHRRASYGRLAGRFEISAGEQTKSALRDCDNADSSFDESKPASHPSFANGFHGTCRSRRDSNPHASFHVEVADLFTTTLRCLRSYGWQASRFKETSRGTFEPDSHPSRGCVLPRKARHWSGQPKYPNSSPPEINVAKVLQHFL